MVDLIETIIIKDSEIQDVKNEIVAIAMMQFGIARYRIQEGYSESILYQLSHEICDELERTGFCEESVISGSMAKECIIGMVEKYIKESK
tara:strand:+ start:819 stop:1088 length:270 start_codon:yes stop_codon:yes gene_type:complete